MDILFNSSRRARSASLNSADGECEESQNLLLDTQREDADTELVMDYESVLEDIGEFGTWQQITEALLWIPVICNGLLGGLYYFTGLQPAKGFRCAIPDSTSPPQQCDGANFTFSDFPESLFPKDDSGDLPNYCKFYRPAYDINFAGNCSHERFTDVVTDCTSGMEYTYNKFQFDETLVTKWDLVCSQKYKVSLVYSIWAFGLMIGSFLFGRMADKYGRKNTLMFSILLSSSSSLLGSFMPEYYSYTATRLVTAIGAQGQFISTFSLVVEIVGSKERVRYLPWVTYTTFFGALIQAPWAIGSAFLTVLASYTESWFTLQWTVSLATFLQLGLWFVLPESPRWLIASGRLQEAEKVIRIAANKNMRKLKEKSLGSTNLEIEQKPAKLKDAEANTLGFRDLFNPLLLQTTLIMFVVWPVVSLGYYGISIGMAVLSDDPFINHASGALIEIPSYILVILLMDVIGRKPLLSCSLLLSGIACILVGSLDKNGSYSLLRQVLALGGQFFAAGTLAIPYMYTSELYPTIMRNTAVGSCSLMARIGGIAAPYVALYLPAVTNASSPYFLMGGLSIFGGILSLNLPETLGSRLPENLDDVAQIKKNGKAFWKCNLNLNMILNLNLWKSFMEK